MGVTMIWGQSGCMPVVGSVIGADKAPIVPAVH
jgi:hypothetical protein